MRKLKGLEQAISVDVVEPLMSDDGWEFSAAEDGRSTDTVISHDHAWGSTMAPGNTMCRTHSMAKLSDMPAT